MGDEPSLTNAIDKLLFLSVMTTAMIWAAYTTETFGQGIVRVLLLGLAAGTWAMLRGELENAE